MSVTNLFLKNGWRKLFSSYRIYILIFVIVFLMQKSPLINCMSELPNEFDVLTPSKPIKEYEEFASYFQKLGNIPDYKFVIENISTLIQHQSELLDREFPLPTFNCSAQIKCSVRYDQFQLSIRFLDPLKQVQTFEAKELPTVTTCVTNYGNPKKHNENLRFVFPADTELIFGTFYPISSLSYDSKIKYRTFYYAENSSLIRTDFLTLQLYVQRVISTELLVEDSLFLWKVDVSGVKIDRHGHEHEYQLAMSPLVYKELSGFRVQLRLFLKDIDCYVEARFFHVSDFVGELRMNLTLVHPIESTKRVSLPIKGYRERYNRSLRRSSIVSKLTSSQDLESFFTDKKLLLAVEMQTFLLSRKTN